MYPNDAKKKTAPALIVFAAALVLFATTFIVFATALIVFATALEYLFDFLSNRCQMGTKQCRSENDRQ